MTKRIYTPLLACFAALLCRPALADSFVIGPWSVAIEPNRAVAGLDDPSRIWTLFVRCVDGHLACWSDAVLRCRPSRRASSISLARSGSTAAPASFPAQTWSLDGFLVPDAGATLPSIEAGRQLNFAFVDGVRHSSMSFLASDTRVALRAVHQRCEAPSS